MSLCKSAWIVYSLKLRTAYSDCCEALLKHCPSLEVEQSLNAMWRAQMWLIRQQCMQMQHSSLALSEHACCHNICSCQKVKANFAGLAKLHLYTLQNAHHGCHCSPGCDLSWSHGHSWSHGRCHGPAQGETPCWHQFREHSSWHSQMLSQCCESHIQFLHVQAATQIFWLNLQTV